MDANFRLCSLACDEDGKRGTGGGVWLRLGAWRATGGEECINPAGGDDWICGEDGGASSSSSSSSRSWLNSDARIVASDDNSGIGGSSLSGMVKVDFGNDASWLEEGRSLNIGVAGVRSGGSTGVSAVFKTGRFSFGPAGFRVVFSLMN